MRIRQRRRRSSQAWALALGLLVLREGAGFLSPCHHHPPTRHTRPAGSCWSLPTSSSSSWKEDESQRRIPRPLLAVSSTSTGTGSSSTSSSNLIEPAAEREPPSPPAPSSDSKKPVAKAGAAATAAVTTGTSTRKRKRPPPPPPPPLPSAVSVSSSLPPPPSAATTRSRPVPPQPRLSPSPGEQRLIDQLEGLRRRRRRDEFRALLRNRNSQGVDVNRLKEEGSIPLLEMFVRTAASCQEVEVAWDVLRSLLDREQSAEIAWVPRWDTFSTLMSACRRRRELDLLLRCFKAALPFQGFSKTVLLNILLAGLCDNGHMDVAAFYLETAEGKWEVTPNEVSWNTLLGAAVRAGQNRLVSDLERKMAAQGVDGDVTTRNIRLQHLLAIKPAAGLTLFERMKEDQEKFRRHGEEGGPQGAVMDLRTINIMAGHLAKTRGYDEAQAMVEEVAARGLGIAPRAVTHNIMLDALLKAGRVDEALEYFYGVAGKAAGEAEKEEEQRRRKKNGRKKNNETPLVDSTTYDILLSGLVQNGRVSTAVVVYNMMCKAGLAPTIYTFAALVRLQKTPTDVYKIWSQARASCPRLSLPFLNILVYELGQVHNDLEGALYAFRAILRMGRRPNTISYNSLLSALMKDANATLPGPAMPGAPLTWPSGAVARRGGGPSARAVKKDGGELLQEDDGVYYPTSSALAPEAQAVLDLLDSLRDRTLLEAALVVLRSMYEGGAGARSARPNARTFTILMAGISKAELGARGTALCVALYREAEAQGVRPNGILCHALLRAFGTDAAGALGFFKKELRVRLKSLDQVNPEEEEEEENGGNEDGEEEEDVRVIDGVITAGGNLSLAYMALLYVCGVSGRADLALQLLYAMQRDGLPSDRAAWDAFESGKTSSDSTPTTMSSLFMGPYESLLRTETMGGVGWETSFNKIRIKL